MIPISVFSLHSIVSLSHTHTHTHTHMNTMNYIRTCKYQLILCFPELANSYEEY